MAIKKITANLNGGDNVSPNNKLTFKVYGGSDGYVTPIHTTGNALTDADVSIVGSNVEITNVDVGSETLFKISSTDEEGNESALSPEFDSTVAIIPIYKSTSAFSEESNKSQPIIPADVSVGDFMVAQIMADNGGHGMDVVGWTKFSVDRDADLQTYAWYYRFADSSDIGGTAPYEFFWTDLTGLRISGVIHLFSGVNSTTPISGFNHGESVNGSVFYFKNSNSSVNANSLSACGVTSKYSHPINTDRSTLYQQSYYAASNNAVSLFLYDKETVGVDGGDVDFDSATRSHTTSGFYINPV